MRAKELAQPGMISRFLIAACDDLENLRDFAKVWQAKGLEAGRQELEDGALTGGTGKETIPTDILTL